MFGVFKNDTSSLETKGMLQPSQSFLFSKELLQKAEIYKKKSKVVPDTRKITRKSSGRLPTTQIRAKGTGFEEGAAEQITGDK